MVIIVKLNNKGQALVEFVLIFPIVIFLLLAAIDIGNIIYTKNTLVNKLDIAATDLENGKTFEETRQKVAASLSITYKENNYATISVSKNVNIITPGLNLALGVPYTVTESKEVYYDKTE